MKALVAHPGGFGEVLLAGPAVRAVATRAGRVTMLCGARGAPAAKLLPHVDDVVVWDDTRDGTESPAAGLVRRLRQEAYDVALVLGPDPDGLPPAARLLRTARVRHIGPDPDGPLPPARLLRTARVRHIGPGADPADGGPDAAGALDAAVAMGFGLRAGDDGRLRVRPAPDTAALTGNGPYVVVHPGAGEPGRAWAAERGAALVARLCDAGHRVVVTGGPDETDLTRRVSGDIAVDLGGRTTAKALAGVLRAADAVVTASAGPAHLADAVGTPVVSLTTPAPHTYRVPTAVLTGAPTTGPDGPDPDEVTGAVAALLGTRG
ncbi:glycosyltransferase family 9 protein [Streptomyces fumanus]|uniref:Glycosyl transferase n=1 Tax=Streptomyces fumanus TaxID=67302 RepID=A0A919DXG7_9ACTN|nr:glycosyltransferase family 9 protein [Streptomyces fumanus]GHE95033.1 glycosyl transferase [Streptomyces fumanus]